MEPRTDMKAAMEDGSASAVMPAQGSGPGQADARYGITEAAEPAASPDAGPVASGKPSGGKKIGKKAVAAIVAVAVVAALIGAVAFANHASKGPSSGNAASAQVTEGDISQVVSGSGSLSADKTVNVLVPAGLEVEQVLVKQGDEVEAGTPIAKVSAASVQEKLLSIEEDIDSLQSQLDNLGSGTEHYDLKKRVLEDQISDLKSDRDEMAKLQDTLTLTSDTAGTVGSVNLYKDTETGQSSLREQQKGASSSSSGASGRDSSGGAGTSALDSASDASQASLGAAAPSASASPDVPAAGAGTATAVYRPGGALAQADGGSAPLHRAGQAADAADGGSATAGDGAASQDEGREDGPAPAAGPARIKGTVSPDVAAPATGAVPQAEVKLADDAPYTAKVSWVPADATFAAQTAYAAIVTFTSKDGYCFGDLDHLDVRLPGCADMDRELLDLDGDGAAETLKVTAYYPATEAAGSASDNGDENGQSGSSDYADAAGGYADADGGSYDLGSSSSDEASSSLTQSGSSTSDTEAIALTVTPNDKMYLDIKVDELDILKVTADQEAAVKVDAIDGEAFTGKIVSIDDGSAKAIEDDSGNSSVKYDVRIELPRDDRMRYGMSAKADITVDEHEGVLLVPVDAVSDVDGKSVVYTSVGDDGTLSSPVEIETGLSDGEQVEVTGGLSAGTTVYFAPATQGDDEEDYMEE